MKFDHPLLKHAQVYPRPLSAETPSNCKYDEVVGAWRRVKTGGLWVSSTDPDDPDPPRTKKADIETGEDRKGE